MKETITNYINEYDICQRTTYVPLVLTETPSKPFELVHMDTLNYNARNYLTLVDSVSKFPKEITILSKTAVCITDALIKYFTSFGTPIKNIVAGAKEFNNITITELLNLHNIKIHFTTPRYQESNSIMVRFHSTIIEHR